MTPGTLHILTNADASVLTSVYVKTLVDPNWHFEAVPAFRSCELPAACTILCVRFTHFVHLWKFIQNFGSAVGATLDTGGWLAVTRQGLSPCKMHQASLGALTSQITGAMRAPTSIASELIFLVMCFNLLTPVVEALSLHN